MIVRYSPVSPAAYAGRRPVLRFLRRRQAPVFVDAPGVAVRVVSDYLEPSYLLVHWEMISEVVVSPDLKFVGLRLRSDPGRVVHRVRVAGWKFERVGFELAVARFSGHTVDVVDETPAPQAQPRPPSPAGPVFVWWRTPSQPMLRRPESVRRTAVLRIDANGIRFGRGLGSDPPVQWFPWSEVESVVLFVIAREVDHRLAVGVTTRPTVPGAGAGRIAAYRIVDTWVPGDRLAIAVEVHGHGVPFRKIGAVPRSGLPD